MPGIQQVGQPSVSASQVQAQQPGAFGSVGNLRFKGEAGATPRAGSPNIFQRAIQSLSRLAFYVTASPQARAQQFERDQQQIKTRALGDVLGHLTAPTDTKKTLNSVASGLARLADLTGGDLANLPGGKQALRAHLQGLGALDVGALQDGVLAQPGARDAVLALVAPGLRADASVVLDQIRQSVSARAAGQVLEQPLTTLTAVLTAPPGDGRALSAALGRFADGLQSMGGAAQDKVNAYLRDLPDNMLRTLNQALAPEGQLAVPDGLAEGERQTLALVGQSVQREGQTRLDAFSASLAQSLAGSPAANDPPVWQACQDQVKQLGMGSPGAVLLKALALPESMSGLSNKRAGEVLSQLPQSTFSDLCAMSQASTDPAKGRGPRLLEQQQVDRRQAAEAAAPEAFRRLEDALARADHGQIPLMANGYKRAMDALRDTGSAAGREVPEAMRVRLASEFGVKIDAEARDVTVTLRDAVRGPLTLQLEEPLPGMRAGARTPATREASLPVDGVARTFKVSEVFFKDAIERPSITLSVSGTDADGVAVDTPWAAGVARAQRPQQLGQALHALERVAGPMAEPLTRLMNQQLGAGILIGLTGMGSNSPFKLPDGSVVMPAGSMQMSFDVAKQPDGSFRIGGVMRLPLDNAIALDAQGRAQPVKMDLATSWAEVSLSLLVSPDGSSVRETEAPQTRHNFTLLSR